MTCARAGRKSTRHTKPARWKAECKQSWPRSSSLIAAERSLPHPAKLGLELVLTPRGSMAGHPFVDGSKKKRLSGIRNVRPTSLVLETQASSPPTPKLLKLGGVATLAFPLPSQKVCEGSSIRMVKPILFALSAFYLRTRCQLQGIKPSKQFCDPGTQRASERRRRRCCQRPFSAEQV